ncbi:MAG: WD40 repeat domain-containing protein [Mariniblastus sp.]
MHTCPANLRSVLSRSSVRSSDTASKDDRWTEGSRRASSTLVHALLIVLFFAGHSCGQSVTEPLPDNAQLPADAIWQFGENESSYNGLYKLAYSADGEYLAARNSDNIVTVYDTKTHQPLQAFAGHDQPIQCVDFSKDGTYVLTGANGQRDDRKNEHTKIWNVQTGELKLDLNIQAYAAFFSSDGENVLIMDEKAVNTVRISDGKLLVKKIWKQSNERPLTMSRDGNRVAFYRSPVAGRVYNLSIYDLTKKSTTILQGNLNRPKYATFSDDNLHLAAIFNQDDSAYLWDLRTRTQFVLSGHSERTAAIAFSSDSRFLATTSLDDSAILWDLLTRQKITALDAHEDNVNSVTFAPLDAKLVTGSSGQKDNRGIIWNLNSLLFSDKKLQPPQPADANAFKHIWIRMSARPPQHALITTRKLALGGVDFIGFLEEKIGVSTTGVDEDEIVKLIGMLNSDQYSERERASIALKKFGPHAISLANQALKNAETAEIRYRITKLLSQPVMRPPIDPQELCRLHRSIMALEMMASGDAVTVSEQAASEVVKRAIFALQSLALGHENIDVANDAQAALDRIAAKKKRSL